MFYKITHITKYDFDKTVFLEPHTLRLIPRNDPYQTVKEFSIKIKPKEAGSSYNIDLDGNTTLTAWFNETHNNLEIKTTSKIELINTNPFDYIITDLQAIKLPLKYEKGLQKQLTAYILIQNKPSKKLIKFAKSVLDESDNGTVRFLSNLSSRIHSSIEKTDRKTGDPYTAETTLIEGNGSCRDLAVLFMESCRIFGLAARFVSGYLTNGEDNKKIDLHAWSEVYIPGAGWRGYDPSTGFIVSSDHIALASGYNSHMASPVSGYFRGDNTKTSLSFDITIKTSN